MSQKLPPDSAQKGFAVGRGLLAAAETLNFSMGESRSDSYGSSSQQHNRMMGYSDRNAQDRTTKLPSHVGNSLSSTMKLFTSLGLSPHDLDTLAQIPEEKISMETLPDLIKQLKNRKTEASRHLTGDQFSQSFTPDSLFRVGRDDWGDAQGGRLDRSVASASQNRTSQGDYGYRSSQDLSSRNYDMLDYGSSRDRQFSELSSDNYRSMGMSSSSTSDDLFMQRRIGAPSQSKVEDFMGIMPRMFPHVCSLCDFDVHSIMEWTQHTTGMRHAESRRVLLQLYPDWDPQIPTGRMSDSLSLNSRNQSDGLLGAAPSGVSRQRVDLSSNWGSDSGMSMTSKMSSYSPKVKSKVVVMKYVDKPTLSAVFSLANRFGTVNQNIILKSKGFLEFQTHEQAIAMVNHFKKKPAILNGKQITIYLSQDLVVINSKRTDQDRRDTGPVVFFSNLPRENEKKMELLTVAGRFGTVVKHLFLSDKAFVQMSNPKDAEMMVKYYTVHPLTISHRSIYINICNKYKNLTVVPDKEQRGKEDRGEGSQRSSRTSSKPLSRNQTSTRSKSKDSPGEKTQESKPKEKVVAKAGPSDQKDAAAAQDEGEEAIGKKDETAEESVTVQPEQQDSEEFKDSGMEQTEYSTKVEDAEMPHGEEQEPQTEEPAEQVQGNEEEESKKLKEADEQEGMEQDEAAPEESAELEEYEEGDFPENMDEFVTLDELAEEEEAEYHDSKSRRRSSSGRSRDSGGMRVVNINGFKRSYGYMEEILALAKPFGKVVQHLILHSRPEAFLELESEEEAKAMVRFYSGNVIPSVCGKEVQIFHSITYATIQSGKVVYIGHVPPIKAGSEASLVKIAEPYGIIKRYYMNRARNECFIEMERGEDAERFAKAAKLNPPRFEGKRLLVYISRKYKQLKHGIRPPTPDKRPAKREHSDEEHENQTSSPAKTSKKTKEPPAKKVKVEKSGKERAPSVPKEENLEEKEEQTELDKSVSEENQESTEQPGRDPTEADGTEIKPKGKSDDPVHVSSAAESEKSQEMSESATVSAENVKKPETIDTLGPYEPDVPVGVEFVKMGYYCRVCFLFYSNEDTAKRVHCSSQAHYDKLKKHLEKEKSKAQHSGEKK
ncbi:matrin 3-like 1.2 isoform X2 [Trichomycterus rosablanca]|uniref:matrin 3-like 1.2 isoform X2 n=1 Tax=Trichomycterus rosablanca TaxID=2290929 RepID=UPI002F3538F0